MNHPVLSIDVAKGKSVAAAFLSSSQLFRKPFSFEHSPSGVESLLPLLAEMQSMTNAQPHVVLEATGNYSKPLTSFFSTRGFPVVVLNPILTHQLKTKAIRKVKTDAIDAARIAQAYYLGNGSPAVPLENTLTELRTLTRQHRHLNDLFTNVQLHFQAVLDLIFPGYDQLFSHTCCSTSLRILSAFPTPHAVLAADPEQLFDLMLPNRRGRSWNEDKRDTLLSLARQSLPDPAGQISNQIMLRCYTDLLLAYKKAIADVENRMILLAKLLPAYHLIQSIPGVGEITASVILAEIGDIKRFPGPKQLSAFAGLDASVFESGTFTASRNRISKRGSSYLRTALYQATVAAVSQQRKGPRNPTLSRYYQQKLAEGKLKKVALVATCHKLLRIIFGVWSNNRPFAAE